MTVVSPAPGVGPLLRDWRQRRRRSQLDLAVEAAVSTRHLSFVETGRAQPSRELVLHLAEHLDVPLRDRNGLLLAAGYSPAYPETPLDAEEMGPVRDAVDSLLGGHQPFPAIAVDRMWNLVSANTAALSLLADGVDPALLEPPANTMKLALHPDGLASRIVNFADYAAHLLLRIDRQATASGSAALVALGEELRTYPRVVADRAHAERSHLLFEPLVLTSPDGELTFFSTLTTFGTALDVTMAELSIEAFFPADTHTATVLRAGWQPGG